MRNFPSLASLCTEVPKSVVSRALPALVALLFWVACHATAAAQIIYVAADAPAGGNGTSWNSAYTSLSVALANSAPSPANPTEIWLKIGVYKPTAGTNRDETFLLKSNLTLRGGFIGGESLASQRPATATAYTILSGDIGGQQSEALTTTTPLNDLAVIQLNRRPLISGDVTGDPARDNSYNVLSASGVTGVVLERLIITGGCAGDIDPAPGVELTAVQKDRKQKIEAQLSPKADEFARIFNGDANYIAPADPKVNGGGLFALNSSISIQNCLFAANYAQGSGGGIMAHGGSLVLSSSIFAANISDYAGGALALLSTNIFAVDSTFYGNKSLTFGGGIFAETTAFPRNADGDLYGTASNAGRSRLYQTQVLLALASSSVGTLLDPNIRLPNDVYGEARMMAAGLGIAKTIVAKVVTGVAKSANATVASFGVTSASAKLGSTLSLAYGAISAAVLVGDIGAALAVYFGVDEFNIHIQRWTAVSTAFNTYLTPVGWAQLILAAFDTPPTPLQRRINGRLADYRDMQNRNTKQTFRNLVFENNTTGGMGGGMMVAHMNAAISQTKFLKNRALFSGGGLALVTYNRTDIENSLFQENTSDRGTSALAVGFRSELRALNNAYLKNHTQSGGSAVSVETGADVTLFNSVLWGNTSGDLANLANPFRLGGADVRADRQADLERSALDEFYKSSEETRSMWLGTCDIQYSCVQGLDSLETGSEAYYYTNDWADQRGYMLESGSPNLGEGIRPSVKTTLNNFSQDPILVQDYFAHPLSPLVDASNPHTIFRTGSDFDLVGNDRNYRDGRIDIGPTENDGRLPEGSILHVDANAAPGGNGLSWATAFKYLPDALAVPLPAGGQIWVAQGTYFATRTNDRDFAPELRPGVVLIGGFANGATEISQSDPVLHPTILSGAIGTSAATDNSKTLLQGVTEPVYGPSWDSNRAAFERARTLPRVVRNFTFSGASGGPALHLVTPMVVKNCRFLNNSGDRALKIERATSSPGAAARVLDSRFEGNSAGAIGSSTFLLDVIGSEFYENRAAVGGAIHVYRTGHYGGSFSTARTRIERSVFANNLATQGRGGAVCYDGQFIEIGHSVFTANRSTPAAGDGSALGGAGLWLSERSSLDFAKVIITNSIFYHNRLEGGLATATTIEHQQIGLPVYPSYLKAPAPIFRGNSIEGLTAYAVLGGEGGNIDYAPSFVNPEQRNYQLSADSVLLNRGVDYASPTDSSAVVGSRDIGAYENPTLTTPRPIVPITFTTPQPTESGRTYIFRLPSHTSGMTHLTWEVRRAGGSFQGVSDSYSTGANTATLTLTNPPHTWNGSIYRLRFINTDGLVSYSENRTLVSLPAILYVKSGGSGIKDGTSWANAMPNPQPALWLAAPYTQVWIAAGDYALTSTAPASGSKIHGGFAGTETSLAQRIENTNQTRLIASDPHRMLSFFGVATYQAAPIPTVLDRLTLVGHSLAGQPNSSLVRFQDADVRATNIHFKDSTPVSIAVAGGKVRLDACTISGGGNTPLDALNATVEIANSAFNGNGRNTQGARAAVHASGCQLVVTDSTFYQNIGTMAGGILSRDGGAVDIRRSRFVENTGTFGSGGALNLRSSGASKVSNSLFARNNSRTWNNAGLGGAINITAGSAELSQLTLVGNNAPSFGGAISLENASATLANSIVWGNRSNNGGAFFGNIGQTGNYQGPHDPLFDPESADYALTAHSPVRDLGGNDPAISGQTDLAGANRFHAGGAADLGASEFAGDAATKAYLSQTPTDQSVFVERPVSFAIHAALGNPSLGTDIVWQYQDGTAWKSISGLAGWTTTLANGTSTLTHPGVSLDMDGLEIRAHFTAVPDLSIPVTLTVKPRLILYVDSRVTASGDGKSWQTALASIREALAIATADTDIWVATGDYAEANLVPPSGARLYVGFAGGETDLAERDPVANPVRIGEPISDRTIIEGDQTVLIPPLPLAAGQTARWQVDRGLGMVDLSADANHVFSVINGIPGLTILGDTAYSGYHYQVVYITGGVTDYVSLPAVITVISRPMIHVDAAVIGGANDGSSWQNAFSDLSAAMTAHPAFSDFKIAAGNYRAPQGAGFVLRRGTALRGGYLAGTDTRDPAASRTVLTSANGATVESAILTTSADRGAIDAGTLVDGVVFSGTGQGISLRSASPAITSCGFENLSIGLVVAGGTPRVDDSRFTGNLKHGIRVRDRASLQVEHCVFDGNGVGNASDRTGNGNGGGIQIGEPSSRNAPVSVTVANSVFTNNRANSGSAVYLGLGANLEAVRSQFLDNNGQGTISAPRETTTRIRQSLFARNTSASGGSAIRSDGLLEISYSTIVANASTPGNAAVSFSGPGFLKNSIVWGNTSADEREQVQVYENRATLGSNLIQGRKRLAGTLPSVEPRFVDAAAGDYRLAAGSPAIDAGIAADLLPGEMDLAGQIRAGQGAAPDLGAYEATLASAPVYQFGLPAALSGPAHSSMELSFAILPTNGSAVWQYSANGTDWTTITRNNVPGAASATVTTTAWNFLTKLTLAQISPPLDGLSLRLVVTVNGKAHASPAVPVTVLPFGNLYVDASRPTSGDGLTWGTAFNKLSEAIAAADSTHRIIQVAAGIYRPTALDSFRLAAFEIYGGWPAGGAGPRDPAANPTILSGLPADGTSPRSEAVVRITEGNFPTVLDGLVIENGGTGIHVSRTSPTLRNLAVRGNNAGGLVLQETNARVEGSLVENNSAANGGGIRIISGNPVLDRNIVRGNTASANGGGIHVEGIYGSYHFTSTLITGNTAALGGGVHAADCYIRMDQATIAGNHAGRGAGVFSIGNVVATLRNSLVWGNISTTPDANLQLDGTHGLAYYRRSERTVVGNLPASEGFLQFDPLFVSPSSGDYRLRENSPAIDRGENSVVSALTLDVAGQPRVVGVVDLGAYESALTGSVPLVITGQPADLTYRRNGSGNTFSVSGTGAASVHWEYAPPVGAFASLVGVPGFSGAETTTLTMDTLSPALNGYRVRAAFTGADGSVIYSDVRYLTVLSPRLHVDANRAGEGAGDGLSWATAFKSLDEALALPYDIEGTEIWVAKGTYKPVTKFQLRRGVSLFGGFASGANHLASRDLLGNATILDGNGGSGPVVEISQNPYVTMTGGVVIDGVTIRNSAGSGVTLVANQLLDVAINRVIFTGLDSALSLTARTTLSDCRFIGNRVAIRGTNGQLTASRCEFRANGGPAGEPVVHIPSGTSQVFENCLFAGNTAAAISLGRTNSLLRHVTVVNNLGGTPISASQGLELQNSIVWGNRTAGSTVVPVSIIGGTSGNSVGNVIEGVTQIGEPVFVSAVAASLAPDSTGDYRPDGTSPVIEQGNNDYTTTLDLAGAPRRVGGHVDAGAYEFQSSPYFITSPVAAAGSPDRPTIYTVSATAPLDATVWEGSSDAGTTWAPLTESATYAGVATAILTVNGTATLGGRLYRARLQFTDGPELASDSARYDHVQLTTGMVGYGSPAMFSATTSGTPISYAWQVSTDNGSFVSVADASGPTLSVSGDPSLVNRSYRVKVTFGNGASAFTNAVPYCYADFAPSPAGISAGGTTGFGFGLAGGVLASSLHDGSLRVHGAWSGLNSQATGDLLAPVIDGDAVRLNFTAAPLAGEKFSVTTTSALRRDDGLTARPRTWQFRNGVRSGNGVFGPALPLGGAAVGTTAQAVADVDDDGDIDALMGGPSGIEIYLNDGRGNLTLEATRFGAANPTAIALGSVTASGGIDAVVATADGNLQVWTSSGSGVVTMAGTTAVTGSPRAIALGDLDGDGDLDVFAACAAGNRVILNDGAGNFSADSAVFGQIAGVSVVLGDVNHDGTPDALVASGSATAATLWLNRGNARFDQGLQVSPGADRVEMADLTGDGLLDLVMTRDLGPTQVWKNNGYGNFQTLPAALGGGIATLATGDVDGDGKADLALTDATGQLGVWTGNSLQRMTDQPQLAFGNRAELVDLDGDGALDLFGLDAAGMPSVSRYHVVASSGPEDADLTLTAAGFTRRGGEGMTHVRIQSLPARGVLLTSALAPVQVNEVLSLAEAAAMVYRPATNVFGVESFTWQPSTDGINFTEVSLGYWMIIQSEIDNVIANGDSITVAQGGTAVVLSNGATGVLANDTSEDAGTLTATLISRPSHGTVTLRADGTFSYVHDDSETRADQFVYQLRNAATGRVDLATVGIVISNVNDAPGSLTVAAGETLYTGQPAGLLAGALAATDPDPEDSGLLTFSLVSGFGDNDQFEILGNIIRTKGALDFSAGLSRSIRVRASDPAGLSLDRTFSLLLVRAPEGVAGSFATVEDASATYTLAGVGGIGGLTYEIVTPPAHGTLGGSANNVLYQPAADYHGADSFTFRVSDGFVSSAPVTVGINISPVNDRPVMTPVDPAATDEHTPVEMMLSGYDVDGDPITFHLAEQGTLGTASISGNILTYVPRADAATTLSADDIFVYALDSSGISSGDLSVRVIISPVNDAPSLFVQQTVYQVLKGEAVAFTGAVTDYDSGSTTIIIGTPPQNGTVSITSDHRVVYLHNPGFTGTDSFTLQASDGEVSSDEVTIQVTVTDPAPVASATTASGDQGTTLQTFLNGYDVQGDPLVAAIVQQPANGSVSVGRVGNASFTLFYTPVAGFHGSDELSFTMTDPGGNVSAPARVSITVNRVNRPPVANALSRSQSGLIATMPLTLAGTDPEGGALSYRIVTPPTHGVLSGTGADFIYTSSDNPFEGSDSFTYVVNDGEQDSAPATVSLAFTRDNIAPSARADFATAYRGFGMEIDVLANDSDSWNNPLFVSDVSAPAHGTAVRAGSGIYYSHNGDTATDDQFTYTLSNFSGVTSTETVFVTIKDHVITLTSLEDAGPGTLREAVEIVNRHASRLVAPGNVAPADWTVQLPGTLLADGISKEHVLTTAAESGASTGDSALVVRGNVTFRSIGGGGAANLRRPEANAPMRLMRIARGARVTLENINLHGGIAHHGGGIYNEGNLTLKDVLLDGHQAVPFYNEPGHGGAIYNLTGTVTLDNVTLSNNTADDGAGLYQLADLFGANVIATQAVFSGNAGSDFRSAARNGGNADFHAIDLTAETPAAPWVGPLEVTTIESRFSKSVPVILNDGESLAVIEPQGGQKFTVTGSGATRQIAATFSVNAAQGPHPISLEARGVNVTFRRDALIILQTGVDQPAIARDDYLAAGNAESFPLTELALLNDEDPDGTPLLSIQIVAAPTKGYITYVQGMPHYTSYYGESGVDTITYKTGNNSNVATIQISIQGREPEITTGTDSGAGSLREGIALSNQFPDQSWIFRPAADALIELTSAGDSAVGDSAFLITGNVTIDGANLPGFVIRRSDDAPAMRLFRVAPGGKLTLKNLSVENGSSARGGAIYNEGTVILDHAVLRSNTATAAQVAGLGGAVYNAGGNLALVDSTIERNTAEDAGETVFGLGGAIYTRNGQVTLTRSTLYQNVAGHASGIHSEGNSAAAVVTMTDTLIDNPTGRSEISSSTSAGGSVVYYSTNTSVSRVEGPFISTIKDTRIEAATGEGIREKLNFSINNLPGIVLGATSSIQDIAPDSGLTISSVPAVASEIDTGYHRQLGVVPFRSGITTVHLSASLENVSFQQIFKLHVDTGVVTNPTGYPDVGEVYQGETTVVDVLANDEDPYGLPLTIVAVTTPAHGTATITADHKISYTHTGTTNPGTDEFFYTIDNGFGGTATFGTQIQFKSTAITVTSAYQLQQAVMRANERPALAWFITVDAGTDQTWSPEGYQFDLAYYTKFIIRGKVTIDASSSPGFTLFAPPGGMSGPPTRLFSVDPGASLTLKSLRLAGGTTHLYNDGVAQGGVGGAIYNRGNFTADQVSFENNRANDGITLGGAIYNNGGDVVIHNSSFLDNSATGAAGFGGAIASRNGSLTLAGVTFTGNSAAIANDVYVFGDGAPATVTVTDSNVTSYELRNFRGGSIIASGLAYQGDNSDPAFGGYSISTGYETGATISLANLLARATDPNGDALAVSGPAISANGGSVRFEPDAILYTPAAGFSGADSFAITFTDPRGAWVTGMVTVNVMSSELTAGIAAETTLSMPPGGDVVIAIRTTAGRSFIVQRSTDMAAWTDVAAVTAGESGIVVFTDPEPAGPAAFYRLKTP